MPAVVLAGKDWNFGCREGRREVFVNGERGGRSSSWDGGEGIACSRLRRGEEGERAHRVQFILFYFYIYIFLKLKYTH